MKRQERQLSNAMSKVVPERKLRAMDGLQNVVAGLGDNRDKRSYSRYIYPENLNRIELESAWMSSWLANRIVSVVSRDMTSEWRDWAFADTRGGTSQQTHPQYEALQQAEVQFQVQAKFEEALNWSRLYGGAMMLLGLKGQEDLSEPLNVDAIGLGDLQFIHVLDRWRVTPSVEMEPDLTSPNFGMPMYYSLVDAPNLLIHHSRFVRFNGQKLPHYAWLRNNRWDASVLQHVLTSVKNVDSVSGNIVSMVFEANVDVVTGSKVAETLALEDGESRMLQRWGLASLMKSNTRLLVLDETEKYDKKGNSFGNLDNIWDRAMQDVAGAAEIPLTKLYGMSPAGLNATGESDLHNYYKMLTGVQLRDLKPRIDYFDQVFVRSVLGSMPPDYDWTFNSLWQMSDEDQATIGFNNAQRDQIYLNGNVITAGMLAADLKQRGVYPAMTDEDVENVADMEQQMSDLDLKQAQQAAKPPKPQPATPIVAGVGVKK